MYNKKIADAALHKVPFICNVNLLSPFLFESQLLNCHPSSEVPAMDSNNAFAAAIAAAGCCVAMGGACWQRTCVHRWVPSRAAVVGFRVRCGATGAAAQVCIIIIMRKLLARVLHAYIPAKWVNPWPALPGQPARGVVGPTSPARWHAEEAAGPL